MIEIKFTVDGLMYYQGIGNGVNDGLFIGGGFGGGMGRHVNVTMVVLGQ